MKKWRILIALVGLALVALPGCAAMDELVAHTAPLVAAARAMEAPSAATPTSSNTVDLTQGDVLDTLQARLEAIYEDVNPSVVSIDVVKQVEMQQMPNMPFFSPQMPETPETPYEQEGAGSGFVWDEDGYIVTNNHVVEGANKITVQFSDGTTAPAELVGADADSDLAVIRVDVVRRNLHPVQLADSAHVKVGQLAVAIGNPFGLENTLTVGFVSALGRSLPVKTETTLGASTYTIPEIIQTDAAINPGNSGGVLVNADGEVIGVPSAIVSSAGTSAGVGFAIPSNIVQKIVPQLIEEGRYVHAWLGISGTTVTSDIAKAMDLDENQHGALVIEVVAGGPAENAGLQGTERTVQVDGVDFPVGGDVIIAMDDASIQDFEDLVANLGRFAPDEEVVVTVLREGRELELDIILGARPGETSGTPSREEASAGPAALGITGMTLGPDIASVMGLPEDQEGVLVGEIQAGSAADRAGLMGSYKPATIDGQRFLIGGDVIVAWNRDPIATLEDLQDHIREAQAGDSVTLTVLRNGDQMRIDVTLGTR